MVVVSGNVNYAFLSHFLDENTLFVSVYVLPRVLDNERRLRVLFVMGLPICCRPTGNARRMLHDLVNDEALCLAVSFDFDIAFTVGYDNGRVKSKPAFVYPEKPEDYGHKL